MDQGWILTFAGEGNSAPQISIATEGGSGTPVPDVSIEVDNFEEVRQRVLAAGLPIEYGPMSEPWGVTRFYVRDPFGRLLNTDAWLIASGQRRFPRRSEDAFGIIRLI